MLKKILFILAILSNQSVFACSVCFGGGNSNLIRGFTWGIGLLLGLPFLLLGSLIGMIVYSIRKNKRHVEVHP